MEALSVDEIPGGPEWLPLRPKLVVEVSYDHFSGGRFRHGTRLVRWRPDKAAAPMHLRPGEAGQGQCDETAGPTRTRARA
jgi:ATP-dependent DNA ligase